MQKIMVLSAGVLISNVENRTLALNNSKASSMKSGFSIEELKREDRRQHTRFLNRGRTRSSCLDRKNRTATD